MENNFYKNPLAIIWMAKNNLMPSYLVVLWILLLMISYAGTMYFDFINFNIFEVSNYYSISTTGLTFTLALFVAGKNVFSEMELSKFANHVDSSGKKGQLLIDFLGPYVFTSMLFLITGLIAIYAPYIKITWNQSVILAFKIFYINLLSLGILSLFNLVIVLLNDVFLASNRSDEI